MHERLAREAGIDLDGDDAPPERIPFLDAFPEAGITGVPRRRRWDAVAGAEAPDLPGDEIEFVTLPDGTVLVDADLVEGALTPVAEAIERELAPPYEAHAVKREDGVWAAGANSLDVVEVPEDIPGDSVNLAVKGDERTFLIDEQPGWSDVPTLEAHATQRHKDFVLHAERLDGNLWSVKVNPL